MDQQHLAWTFVFFPNGKNADETTFCWRQRQNCSQSRKGQ
jgi:hypothetical protein